MNRLRSTMTVGDLVKKVHPVWFYEAVMRFGYTASMATAYMLAGLQVSRNTPCH